MNKKFIPIVLCAGFGTRLKPLTNFISKAACPIINKPVSFTNIEQFFLAGFEKVYCNTHYLANDLTLEIKECAKKFGYNPKDIIFFHEEEILETGGGIINIVNNLRKIDSNFIEKDIFAVAGDIYSEIKIADMIEKWEKRDKLEKALMCTRETVEIRKDATWISLDKKHVLGFGEGFENKENCLPRVFNTHQIISNDIFYNKAVEKKSSIDIIYRDLLIKNNKIINFEVPNSSFWFDIGNINDYFKCLKHINNNKSPIQENFLNSEIEHIDKYLSNFENNSIEIAANSITENDIIINLKTRKLNLINKTISLSQSLNNNSRFIIKFIN